MQIVSKIADVRSAMDQFHEDLPESPGLASRLGQAHAFYVLPDKQGKPRFGFSKFVGYRGLTAANYLKNYKKLNGLNTEHALKPWFQEVMPGSSTYDELYEQLSDWLAQYDKRPRQGKKQHTRIMVLKPEADEDRSHETSNREILDLLIIVAKMLPVHQRSELRSSL